MNRWFMVTALCLAAACPVPSCERAGAPDAAPVAAPSPKPSRADCEAECGQVPDVELDAWDDLPPEEAAEQQRLWLEGEQERIKRSPEYADCIARCAPK